MSEPRTCSCGSGTSQHMAGCDALDDARIALASPSLDVETASLLRELDACQPRYEGTTTHRASVTFSGWYVPDWLMQRLRAALASPPLDVERLREALEPFREQAETWLRMVTETADNVYPLREDTSLQGGQTVGDWANLARAIAALASPSLDEAHVLRCDFDCDACRATVEAGVETNRKFAALTRGDTDE